MKFPPKPLITTTCVAQEKFRQNRKCSKVSPERRHNETKYPTDDEMIKIKELNFISSRASCLLLLADTNRNANYDDVGPSRKY